MNKKIIKALTHPRYACLLLLHRLAPLIKDDEKYVKWNFYLAMGKKLNLENPQTFNEKLQWLKLYDRRPEYTKLVDKYEVKQYIKEKLGEKYVIPTLGVWDTFDEIDFSTLPNQFVLKCTHDSGGLVICKDKSTLDVAAARKKINRCLKRNYYYGTREYPYKEVKPRIIAEKFMVDESGVELKDYKFFCFNGDPRFLFVATDRQKDGEETKFDFFDTKWKHLPFTNGHPNNPEEPSKPENLEEMLRISKLLSQEIPHVRVDLYDINGKIYFGELTFFHWSGLIPFNPETWDEKFGEMISLPIN